ncbi:hypothetical protein POM88_021250 [Heracleum sosnowskyi]|uniref:Uncharacterized protein n=1 Tax=Heracleum sosnowskyi TaxID=360622 RepID=A0AAD8IGJ2_9APIA|nr:hypothetical protein POM88_021250 [Heracleum sosnowskyi]
MIAMKKHKASTGDRSTNNPTRENSTYLMIRLYTLNLHYEGHFVHIHVFSYTSNINKIIENVDLENWSIDELKNCGGDDVGEFDSLYYVKGTGIALLNKESKAEVIEFSRACGNQCTLYVYHQTPNDESDEDIDYNYCSDEELIELRKTNKVEQKRMDEYERLANLEYDSGYDECNDEGEMGLC